MTNRNEIRRAAKSLLRIMDKNNINSIDDLKKAQGYYQICEQNEAFINICSLEKDSGAYVMDYNDSEGIKLHLRLNLSKQRSRIVLRCYHRFEGYEVLHSILGSGDSFQDKKIESVGISRLRDEIKSLAN